MAHIRDLRERKNLSQDKVAEAAGLSYSAYVRVEEGRADPAECERVYLILKDMEPGTRKLGGGRPFKDPEKQARVMEARRKGRSVGRAMGLPPTHRQATAV